jgi:hypothetical protein
MRMCEVLAVGLNRRINRSLKSSAESNWYGLALGRVFFESIDLLNRFFDCLIIRQYDRFELKNFLQQLHYNQVLFGHFHQKVNFSLELLIFLPE